MEIILLQTPDGSYQGIYLDRKIIKLTALPVPLLTGMQEEAGTDMY